MPRVTYLATGAESRVFRRHERRHPRGALDAAPTPCCSSTATSIVPPDCLERLERVPRRARRRGIVGPVLRSRSDPGRRRVAGHDLHRRDRPHAASRVRRAHRARRGSRDPSARSTASAAASCSSGARCSTRSACSTRTTSSASKISISVCGRDAAGFAHRARRRRGRVSRRRPIDWRRTSPRPAVLRGAQPPAAGESAIRAGRVASGRGARLLDPCR